MLGQMSRESRRQSGRLGIGRGLLAAVSGAVMCQGCILAGWDGYARAGKPRQRYHLAPSQERTAATAQAHVDTVDLAAAAGDEWAPVAPPVVSPRRSTKAGARSLGGKLQSAGPRCGVIFVTGNAAKGLRAKGVDPVLTTWGWQFEYQYETSSEGPVGLVEFVPLLAGMEQGQAIPSANVLFGLRTAPGWEFVIGPNLGPASRQDTSPEPEPYPGAPTAESSSQTLGIGLTVAVGKTFKAGPMNFPVNLAVVSNHDGVRYSITFGWNVRQ